MYGLGSSSSLESADGLLRPVTDPRPGSNSAHILSSRPDHKLFPHTLTRFFQRPAVARASSPCVAILYWGTLAYQEVPGFLACPQRMKTL